MCIHSLATVKSSGIMTLKGATNIASLLSSLFMFTQHFTPGC